MEAKFKGDLKKIKDPRKKIITHIGFKNGYDIFSDNPILNVNDKIISDILTEAGSIKRKVRLDPEYSRIKGSTLGVTDGIRFAVLWNEKQILITERVLI